MRIFQTAFRSILCIFFMLLMTGCVLNDISDLEQYVEDILARSGGRIEPIPEIKPYEVYTYESAAQNTRDPFQLFYQEAPKDIADTKDPGLTEEMENEIRNRSREELEQFELDSLRMVGTLEDGNEQWGIIKDPSGTVHRVRVGNYIGKNIGKILNIFEDKIDLREIIKNSQGRWEERQAAIALAGGSEE